MPVANLQASDYHSLAVSPRDSNVVWFGSHTGVQESSDAGVSWHPLPGVSGDAMSIARPASDVARVYIAGHNIFKRSTDGGATWQDVQTDLPGTDLHGFAANAEDAQHLYALVAGQGVFESSDGGSHWQPLPAQPPGAQGSLASAGGTSPALYTVTALGVMRSLDAGKGWHPASSGLPEGPSDVRSLVSVPGKPQELYAGTASGLYHTVDGGTTWSQRALAGESIVALAAGQSGALRLYALTAGGAVFRLEGAALAGAR